MKLKKSARNNKIRDKNIKKKNKQFGRDRKNNIDATKMTKSINVKLSSSQSDILAINKLAKKYFPEKRIQLGKGNQQQIQETNQKSNHEKVSLYNKFLNKTKKLREKFDSYKNKVTHKAKNILNQAKNATGLAINKTSQAVNLAKSKAYDVKNKATQAVNLAKSKALDFKNQTIHKLSKSKEEITNKDTPSIVNQASENKT